MRKIKLWQVVDLSVKIFSVCLCAALLLALFPVKSAAASPGDLSAQACVLMAAETREVLYARNADEQLPMASTTKIMTSLLALESGYPEREIVVTDEMVRVEGTSIGLLAGDTISLRTLVSGMLLESGNDAANVTAYAVAGGIEPFLELMNAKAQEIGMQNTHFETVSGLDSENHYSTAYDMSLLAACAIENPLFRQICSLESERVYYGNPPYARTLSNHNRLLKSYDGAFGIKTGYTKKSGRCLVSAAERDGVTLIAVTLNAPNDWADHRKLLDYGFSVAEARDCTDLTAQLPNVPVVGGDASTVRAVLAETPFIDVAQSTPQITAQVFVQPFLYAPLKAGDCIGSVQYTLDGKTILEIPLVAESDVSCTTAEQEASQETDKPSLWERIKSIFGRE